MLFLLVADHRSHFLEMQGFQVDVCKDDQLIPLTSIWDTFGEGWTRLKYPRYVEPSSLGVGNISSQQGFPNGQYRNAVDTAHPHLCPRSPVCCQSHFCAFIVRSPRLQLALPDVRHTHIPGSCSTENVSLSRYRVASLDRNVG